MSYSWLTKHLNRKKPLGKSIIFSIAFIIVNSLGLTAIRANELIQPIDLQQPVDIQSNGRVFRAFKSIVDRYDCLSPSAETRSNEIRQIERNKFAKDLHDCTDRIKDLAGIATADLETLNQLQIEFATELTAIKGKNGAIVTGTIRTVFSF